MVWLNTHNKTISGDKFHRNDKLMCARESSRTLMMMAMISRFFHAECRDQPQCKCSHYKPVAKLRLKMHVIIINCSTLSTSTLNRRCSLSYLILLSWLFIPMSLQSNAQRKATQCPINGSHKVRMILIRIVKQFISRAGNDVANTFLQTNALSRGQSAKC